MLLDHDRPAADVVDADVEAEEAHVGGERAAEDRAGAPRAAARRVGVDDRVRVAAQQLAAHQHHEALVVGPGGSRPAERAVAPGGDRRRCRAARPGALARVPEPVEVGGGQRRREAAPQQLAPHLGVEPDEVGLRRRACWSRAARRCWAAPRSSPGSSSSCDSSASGSTIGCGKRGDQANGSSASASGRAGVPGPARRPARVRRTCGRARCAQRLGEGRRERAAKFRTVGWGSRRSGRKRRQMRPGGGAERAGVGAVDAAAEAAAADRVGSRGSGGSGGSRPGRTPKTGRRRPPAARRRCRA